MRLTKLSAALAAIALSLVGLVEVAAPANAVGGPAASATPNTFSPSTGTQAFTLTVPSTGSAITNWIEIYVNIQPQNSSAQSWAPTASCQNPGPGFTPSLAACGITSFTVGGATVNDAVAKKTGQSTITIYRPANASFTNAASNEVVISFAQGAFTAPATAGSNYIIPVFYNAQTSVSITAAPVSVSAVNQTVTFDANGGTGSIPQQTASQATNLTSNTTQITRTGFDFAGWNTAANGSGTAYANGASFPFTSSATLYAQWTAQNGSSTATAGTGSGTVVLNLAVGQPIAGAPVDLNVTGMQAGAAWDTTVRSTPQSIGAGTIPSNGNLTSTVYLPSNLGAGWHSITFTSTDASGNPFTTVSYFQVSASGTLVSTSNSLASTGAETFVPFGAAAALLLAGAAIALIRRRAAE